MEIRVWRISVEMGGIWLEMRKMKCNVILYLKLAQIYNSSHQQKRMRLISANQKNNNKQIN